MRTLIRNGKVLSPRPSNRPLFGEEMRELVSFEGSIYVREGRIVATGSEADYLGAGAEVLDAKGRIVTPALVDPHTHLVFAGDRSAELRMKLSGMSYLEILSRGYGIYRTVEATRKASTDELRSLAEERLGRMRSHGAYVVEAKSGYGLNAEAEVKVLRVINSLEGVVPTLLAHVVPKGWDEEDYVEYFKGIIDRVSGEGLARFFDVFCDRGAFSLEGAKELMQHARSRGLRLKIHAEELARTGASELAAELGAVSADHLERADEEAMEALASSGVIGVLLPTTELALLGGPRPNARRMLEKGMAIALGTDFNPNNWVESLQFVFQYSVLALRLLPEEALSAATLNAAHAVGEGSLGAIAEGYRAALAVWDASSLESLAMGIGVNRLHALVTPERVVTVS